MRKLILAAAVIIASAATADAGQSRGLVLANADTPTQAQPAVAPDQAEAQSAPSQAQPTEAPRAHVSRSGEAEPGEPSGERRSQGAPDRRPLRRLLVIAASSLR